MERGHEGIIALKKNDGWKCEPAPGSTKTGLFTEKSKFKPLDPEMTNILMIHSHGENVGSSPIEKQRIYINENQSLDATAFSDYLVQHELPKDLSELDLVACFTNRLAKELAQKLAFKGYTLKVSGYEGEVTPCQGMMFAGFIFGKNEEKEVYKVINTELIANPKDIKLTPHQTLISNNETGNWELRTYALDFEKLFNREIREKYGTSSDGSLKARKTYSTSDFNSNKSIKESLPSEITATAALAPNSVLPPPPPPPTPPEIPGILYPTLKISLLSQISSFLGFGQKDPEPKTKRSVIQESNTSPNNLLTEKTIKELSNKFNRLEILSSQARVSFDDSTSSHYQTTGYDLKQATQPKLKEYTDPLASSSPQPPSLNVDSKKSHAFPRPGGHRNETDND